MMGNQGDDRHTRMLTVADAVATNAGLAGVFLSVDKHFDEVYRPGKKFEAQEAETKTLKGG